MSSCCICGRPLPNRFAIGGTCEEPGCDAVFCHYHWRNSNHRCPQHGYQPTNTPATTPHNPKPSTNNPQPTTTPHPPASMPDQPEPPPVPPARAKQAMSATLALVQRMGRGAGDLFKRLTKSKTPQDMADELEAQLSLQRERRATASRRVEELYEQIAAKKKAHAGAPKARQRVLEMELRALLGEYQAAERTLGILLENERHLTLAKGRLDEVLAYGGAALDEDLLDDLTDQIDEAAAAAEDRADAARDLERAGKRRQRESDTEDLWEALDGFDTPETETTLPEPEPPPPDPEPGPSRERNEEL
jgi:hypothetical protein